MQTDTADRLDRFYRLLPAIHRLRDGESGEPLRALLQIIAEQAALIEDDIAQAYDDWFIETCRPWVVPYIADLIGVEMVDAAASAANPWALPRRDVANTLRYRRRKGTLALLELLAGDVAGWPARAVEFGRQLTQTQSTRLIAPGRGRSADLRDGSALAGLGSAFDGLAHNPDLRRLISVRATGRMAAASVGVFVWRLRSYPVTQAPACCVEDVHPNCYAFSVLGNDAPLFNRARPDADPANIAGPRTLPLAIPRRLLAKPAVRGTPYTTASTDYYGLVPGSEEAQSIAVWAPGWPKAGAPQPIPAEQVIPSDLTDWSYAPPPDHIAIDPVRGRIAFPPRQLCKGHVSVGYHYGFSADLGGGEYDRQLRTDPEAIVVRVRGIDALRRALRPWRRRPAHQDDSDAAPAQPRCGVIEILDSGVYAVPLDLWLEAGHSLQIRAAQRTRPVLRLLDWQTDAPDSLTVSGGAGSRFILDGIMLVGRGAIIEGELASFTVRHSTLVPGWSLDNDCCPRRPAEASIAVVNSGACIVIDHSITGSIQVDNSEVTTDPIRVEIGDSIVDATGVEGEGPQFEAIGASGSALAFATLRLVRSTVIGRVMTHVIELAENSILLGRVTVARRQIGCVRFSYVADGSRTPRRYACQPDLALAATGRDAGTRQQALDQVRPRFDNLRYGTPTYCRLSADGPQEIGGGADDRLEMGVFHHLHEPQRLAALGRRLADFTPANTDTAVIYAD